MDGSIKLKTQQTEAPDPTVGVGVTFLRAIFAESDTILFRPIETWSEGRRKRSRVDYRNTCYCAAVPQLLKLTVSQQLSLAVTERVNLFFGVCPRPGNKGRYDLAWQIRIVRVIWTDIDHVSVDEAINRVTEAGLPTPSVIVNSGNGAHLYWLLENPYLIDDAGDPPPVDTEWTQESNGRKKPRKYIVEDGERIYLDQQRHVSRLSAKAQHFQDVLSGVAQALGGDHTTDLSRLLRIPGSFNRKNQRNGSEPVQTVLVECDPSRRYPLSHFESLKTESQDTKRAQQIAAMPLPQTRKISASKADKLAELIAASAIAPDGQRSEADFAVCCCAIRSGIARDEVWSRVEQVGKFAEQGERYFDVTWSKAEQEVRSSVFDKLSKANGSKDTKGAAANGGVNDFGPPPTDRDTDAAFWDRPTIAVDPTNTPVADTLRETTDHLLATGYCFSRAEQLVVVHDDVISPILSTSELAGLLNEHVEFYFVSDESGQFKPFPPAYGNTWLNQRAERRRFPVINLFTRNPVYTEDWRLVIPGFDKVSGIYYAGPPVEVRDSTEHLDALLRDFCFKSPGDRTNYIGMLLTALLIPRFVGSKPAALFNGNQPELGKSILAQIIATLRDGHTAETATYNPNDEEFEKRLGSIVRRGVTTIIIDNAKGRARNPRIESACLERSITDPILSFRLLGYSQEIRAENSHIFCITANTPDVSRDLVTRSCVINLYHEGDPKRRSFSIDDPEEYAAQHRLELLGELIGMVKRWKASGMPKANVHSRFNKRGWGTIVGGILEACGEPDFLANADEAADALDETRRDFGELISVLADHPQGTWTAAELVEQCNKHRLLSADLGEGSARSLSTKMGTLAGRFVGERFTLDDRRHVVFHRSEGRKGKLYRIYIEDEVPNLEPSAEPRPNLHIPAGSAF